MSVREEQSQFVKMVGKFIGRATFTIQDAEDLLALVKAREAAGEKAVALTFGDAYRDPRVMFPYGKPHSLHKSRLAIDFNVFKDGRYLSGQGYPSLGEFWESIGGSWGGRWGDPNHFSLGESDIMHTT